MFKKVLDQAYGKIVKINPYVNYFYSAYKLRHARLHAALKPVSWAYLAALTVKYRVFGADAKKKCIYPESEANVLPDPEKLAARLAKARVLSFNVFGTLLLTRTEQPCDLFNFIGHKLGVNDYKTVRTEAEAAARRNGRAGLRAVCAELERRYGIDAARAHDEELEALRLFCYANPYFLRILAREECRGKQLVAVSDTCYSASFVGELLARCGFRADRIFVSCEHGCSKEDGGLWGKVCAEYGKKGVVHVGDDYEADVKNSRRAGLSAAGVPNLALACGLYRDFGPRSAVRSLYAALVGTKLHFCGLKLSPFYEHGYAYGGLLVYGFCFWLDRMAKYRGYDRLVFLARDSEVFYKVYRKYFGSVPSVYLYTSRFAALKLVVPRYFNMFTDIMFERKIPNGISIGQSLDEAELSRLRGALPQWGLAAETRLDKSVIDALKEFLYANASEIAAAYRGDKEAFERYSAPLLAGAKRACLIDLGWCGTIFTALETYFREAHPEQSFYGAMLGVSDAGLPDYLLDSGKMDSYVFSYKKDQTLIVDKSQIMLLETMFSSERPSTQGYAPTEDGGGVPVFERAGEADNPAFRFMRRGMYDFCEDFAQVMRELPFRPHISGAEAYAPLAEILPNVRYNVGLFGKLKTSEDPNSEPVAMSRLLDEAGYTSNKKR